MNIPSNLKYTKDHEWVLIDGDEATVGITDFAQKELACTASVPGKKIPPAILCGGLPKAGDRLKFNQKEVLSKHVH